MALIQGVVELLPDKETFDKTPCPKCGIPFREHMTGDQWEATCDVTIDELVKAGLMKIIR